MGQLFDFACVLWLCSPLLPVPVTTRVTVHCGLALPLGKVRRYMLSIRRHLIIPALPSMAIRHPASSSLLLFIITSLSPIIHQPSPSLPIN